MVARQLSLKAKHVTDKSELRKHLINLRQIYVLKQNNKQFPGEFFQSYITKLIKDAKCVAGYKAASFEPAVDPLMRTVERHDVMIALPWLPPGAEKIAARQAAITFRQWTPGDPLVVTALGFEQPDEMAPILTPDLILTPLLGFDRKLNRLGQGAGHYDRAFAEHPEAIRIGVAWSVQEVDSIPVDPWDVSLDAILTEREWIVGPASRI